MQDSSRRLFALPQLGRDVFNRGRPEGITIIGKSVYVLSLYDLLHSYSEIHGRAEVGTLHIEPTNLFTMEESLRRLSAMLGGTPGLANAYELPSGRARGWPSAALGGRLDLRGKP